MKKREYQQAGITTHAEPVSKTITNHLAGQPTRYYFERRSLKGRKRRFTRKRYFVPVEFGDPRYADAPYEMTVFPTPPR